MSLNDPNIVDAIGIEQGSGIPILTLIDSWDWSDEPMHLSALREKLNSYFNFIESGQITETHPNVNHDKIIIDIFVRHEFPSSVKLFIDKVTDFAQELNVELRIKTLTT